MTLATAETTESDPEPALEEPALEEPPIQLRLYVAGQTLRSLAAIANLGRICRDRLAIRYVIEVIDLIETPRLARVDQIVAIPTLVRQSHSPTRKIIGDLSNVERVLNGLDLRPHQRKDS